MSRFFRLFSAALLVPALAVFAMAVPVAGQESQSPPDAYSPENVARVDILPGWRQADGSHVAALRIRLADGWKTYWRAPGEGGIPPSFDWAGSQNLRGVTFQWPVPDVFDTAGMRTIGYFDELILPMRLSPARDGGEIMLEGRIFIGVCRDVCMPLEARFSATLPAEGQEGAGSGKIRHALGRRPVSGAEAGLSAVSCDVEPISDGLRLTARLSLPRLGRSEIAVIELADQSVWISQAEVRREGGMLVISSDLVPPSATPFALSRADIRITVLAGARAVDIQGCVAGS